MHNFDVTQRRYHTLLIAGICLPMLFYVFFSYVFLRGVTDFYYVLIFSRVFIWAALGLLFVFAKYGECQPFLLLPHEPHSFSWNAQQVIILFLLALACGMVAAIPRFLGYYDTDAVMRKMAVVMHQYPVLRYATCITAGITEELIFRGYVLSRLIVLFKDKYKYWPVIISALIFGFIHLSYKSLSEVIFATCFGLVYGYHYQKYRNLYPLIITHALIDLMATSIRK